MMIFDSGTQSRSSESKIVNSKWESGVIPELSPQL